MATTAHQDIAHQQQHQQQLHQNGPPHPMTNGVALQNQQLARPPPPQFNRERYNHLVQVGLLIIFFVFVSLTFASYLISSQRATALRQLGYTPETSSDLANILRFIQMTVNGQHAQGTSISYSPQSLSL